MLEQRNNLTAYIEKFREKFDARLAEYNVTGKMEWDAPSWYFGEKGVAWLKETKHHGFNFALISKKYKGLTELAISHEYQSFMRAYHMQVVCSTDGLPSGSKLDKDLQVMKRWYFDMVEITGQTHPMYLTAEIIYAAMDRHKENSKSAPNVSDYCDVAVTIIKNIRRYNLTLVNVEVANKYPCRNQSNGTKQRRKAVDANPEQTDDEKLISIRAFMCVIELIMLAEKDSERIFYNMLLLGIICGFRFQELLLLTEDSLVRRNITDEDKRQHAIDNSWPTYRLGIEYLGAKQAGWRIHWLAPSSYPVVEAIFDNVKALTAESRKMLKGYRASAFTDFLPDEIKELPDEWIECRDLVGLMFTGTGGVRKAVSKSIINSIKKFSEHEPKVIPVHNQLKNNYFTKGQLNDYVYQRYAAIKNFETGHQCVISAKNGGDWEHFNYEDLLFIAPEGSFFIDFDLVSLRHPVPLDEHSVEAWLGGAKNRKSIFDAYNLLEDDGSRVELKKHVPRHNINTFLAIAGVTDHIQAILMGRIDITQNKHYQHQAESQEYRTAALAVTALEKTVEENKKALSKDDQLSLFDPEGEPTPPPPPKPLVQKEQTSVSRRMAVMAKAAANRPRSGVDAVKKRAAMMVDPKLSMELNMKQNMQTYGETPAEIAHFVKGAMSDNFVPDIKEAHDKLIKQKQAAAAKALLERHAKLHPLDFGGCTRDVARWGCPHAMKCQTGLPCGYFSLTGRMGEEVEISRRLAAKKKDVIMLRKLHEEDPSFELALKEQEEAQIVLEAFESKAIDSLKPKKLVSLFSEDKDNPLARIIERVNEQTVIGKKPKTLADMFFIEQKRMERDANKEAQDD
uniref:Uncharacterized protein n=1 Tax=Aliivibrio wodanis TaxID=80852 RepID=A0A5Q4ZUL4_9GAMM|nr:hypothetical protein [Aliivibrio wodanis]VVV06172.1 hypothetical protein AW0309160_03656 [Aliivibrio wodanis]VVV06182.1 hypothetical protein AW0309160_03666 [Aliivibrio wodanis]VVV06797.1 hypothetical protein AW0309160_04291 [Aliivibrio wodanis]VVV06848.1 hypothetical protein AW0309160_04342 [Aliivibrio wodanis]VVV06949.1 hypothetical protein AW0309160_04443 [Aliivibrio wodanis]